MFTGIIQGLGTVIEKRPSGGGIVFCLEAGFEPTDPEEGESIAVNGACLTARDIKGRRFFGGCLPGEPDPDKSGAIGGRFQSQYGTSPTSG